MNHYSGFMSTVEDIKCAIAKLSIEEQSKLMSDLCGWSEDEWDVRMKADAAAGKFDELNREADTAHAAGQTHPLDEVLNEP